MLKVIKNSIADVDYIIGCVSPVTSAGLNNKKNVVNIWNT